MRFMKISFFVCALCECIDVSLTDYCTDKIYQQMQRTNSSCPYSTARLANANARTGETCSYITETTLRETLALGKKVAECLDEKNNHLSQIGATVKARTPNQGHFINNFADEISRARSHESRAMKYGTKLLQHYLADSCKMSLTNVSEFISNTEISVKTARILEVSNRTCYDIYRSYDGSCNNVNHPDWGMSNTPLKRLLPPRYSDGVDTPPCSVNGGPLPNARFLSLLLFPELDIESYDHTLVFMEYGQWIAHDLALAPSVQVGSQGIDCCTQDGRSVLPQELLHEDCLPIIISPNDPFYSKYKLRCMNFVRSMTAPREDGKLCPVDQMNSVTSYIDNSPTYGSDRNTTDNLRLFRGGRLRISTYKGRNMLPTVSDPTQSCDVRSTTEPCYVAGDVRVNQNPQVVCMHTLMLREHNRIANRLSRINPHWDDERIFQEARRICIAEHQHITFAEWLPLLVGEKYLKKYNLDTTRKLYSTEYNPYINAATLNSFTAAANRVLHSNVAGFLNVVSESRNVSKVIRMSDYFSRPLAVQDNYDGLLRGMCTQHMLESDSHVDHELSRFLFKSGQPYGKDLVAIDIQRGRDHGLGSYNQFRKLCGLQTAEQFQDFLDTTSERHVDMLSMLYDHPDDVDLYVGAVLERRTSNSTVGPTVQCILAEQYCRSRIGDRYFYDNKGQPYPFTSRQLLEIKKTTVSRLVCDNSDEIHYMQPQGFIKISSKNKLVPCEKLPKMDLSAWKEPLTNWPY